MKLLLTGATGFIGTNLEARLKKDGHEVLTIGRSFNNNVQEIVAFMNKEKFDGVIHLASLFLAAHKPEDIKNLIESNVLFPTTVLESAVAAKIPWFINTGTFWQHYKDKMYSPVNLYAATKQAFEDIAAYYMESSPINFVTIKLFNVFGPKDPRPKVFNLWLKISQSKETLEMSPGEQVMDITYIDNVIEGYVRMIELLSKDSKRKFNGKSFAIPSKSA
jgi:CDP-paratose synthetase